MPAPFMSLMLGLVIIMQAFTLPLPVAFLFVDAGAPAMTKGCKKKTCCTALCYLDKNGVHQTYSKYYIYEITEDDII